jgi:hypothetical protein
MMTGMWLVFHASICTVNWFFSSDELDAYSSSPVPEVSNKRLRKYVSSFLLLIAMPYHVCCRPSNKVRYMEADADPDVPVNKKTSKSQVSSPAKSQLSSAKAQKPTLSVVDISSSEDDQPLMSARQEKSTVQAKGNRTPAVTGSAKKVAGGRSAASPQAVVMSSSEDEQLPTSVKQEKSSPQAKDKRALAGVASSIGKAAGRRDVARMTAPQEVPTHVSESEYVIARIYPTVFESVHFAGLRSPNLIVVPMTPFLVKCMALAALLIGVL